MKMFKKRGYALLCGKAGYYPVSKLSSIIVKTKKDLLLAEYAMKALKKNETYSVNYDNLVRRIV